MKKPVCRVCGAAVVNGNLYCSKDCGQQPKKARELLAAAGFERDVDAPNVWRKNGVAVTQEQVNSLGIDVVAGMVQ